MALTINIQHLERRSLQLEGELGVEELGLAEPLDELIQSVEPLRYCLEVERQEGGLVLQGRLEWVLNCDCARCLKAFREVIQLDPWAAFLPWEGEDAVVVRNDCVDLTPYLSEDMVLALPQRPLCGPDCKGLRDVSGSAAPSAGPGIVWNDGNTAWRELDKLDF